MVDELAKTAKSSFRRGNYDESKQDSPTVTSPDGWLQSGCVRHKNQNKYQMESFTEYKRKVRIKRNRRRRRRRRKIKRGKQTRGKVSHDVQLRNNRNRLERKSGWSRELSSPSTQQHHDSNFNQWENLKLGFRIHTFGYYHSYWWWDSEVLDETSNERLFSWIWNARRENH